MGVVVVWRVKRKSAKSELCYIVKLKGVRCSFTWLSILTTYGTIRYYANVIYLCIQEFADNAVLEKVNLTGCLY